MEQYYEDLENNESAMRNSGWSKAKAYWLTYLIAGIFAAMGGIAQSSITAASDVMHLPLIRC